ncbi:selenocysteine insertion sequence-binding protein 2 [Rhinatrema bivittatum]|uniref:selenocysteine insertion sequence-binding protein 2 n=1 Tax=Rhinatrema bivittatum TaxID=194408 RepID=UPI00112BB1E0|nr:selenocysteine insertion sequence-binding protein 2 [Rhinatrema bivittatum]XP_029474319.1 selenocysteine insertion sequence-binding protein 2 [Rhinatrema bivittatum]XP_029474329.1 selenocysteine insertion sequence-binding protein 2 [Rhinatrema bivittatum]XP_029474337.1 selenocysteine insertion sequence-binding protein 2 [Rhinatrema bivittatum]XP_029474345.1 selenocysteine insertion sequence-binding protein 2 [Rhinatrema bivittatum]XP_029474353.1 selenocysteine insertion sequence-binding pro
MLGRYQHIMLSRKQKNLRKGRKEGKKNKKKAKPNDADSEKPQNENVVIQNPPKLEDTEEFPDLAASTGRSDRGLKVKDQKLSPHSQINPEQPVSYTGRELVSAFRENYLLSDLQTPETDKIPEKKPGQRNLSALEARKMLVEASKAKNSGKKSKAPVQLDLGDILAALEQRQHTEKQKPFSKPIVLSVGSAAPVLTKESATAAKHQQLKQGTVPHNPLDSSAPLVKKGKQREIPKAKKPTSLKKIILKEREQRKQQHLLQGQDVVTQREDLAPEDQEENLEDEICELALEDTFQTETAENSIVVSPVPVAQSGSQVLQDSPDVNCPAAQPSNLPKIHSRRFREYCSQVLSKEVDSCVTELLKELVRFQDRLYQKDPIKAKTKRRLVMGLREVLKHLKLRKLECVIISPNCEKIQSKGGLDETLHTIIACACEQNIPFVFALNRKALGRCLNKAVPVSVVGIFSYDGAQDYFHKMVELTMKGRQAYKDMITALENGQAEEENTKDFLPGHEGGRNLSEIDQPPLEDEPNYIKIWKRMLEEEYDSYSLTFEENTTTEMLNLKL